MMDDQLQILFEYTKFHIGVYITIGSAIVGALAYDAVNVKSPLGCAGRVGFQLSLLFLLFAGLGGGIIAGNLINFTSFQSFHETPIYWGHEPLFWERLEHWSFWISITIGAISGAWLIPKKTS